MIQEPIDVLQKNDECIEINRNYEHKKEHYLVAFINNIKVEQKQYYLSNKLKFICIQVSHSLTIRKHAVFTNPSFYK